MPGGTSAAYALTNRKLFSLVWGHSALAERTVLWDDSIWTPLCFVCGLEILNVLYIDDTKTAPPCDGWGQGACLVGGLIGECLCLSSAIDGMSSLSSAHSCNTYTT